MLLATVLIPIFLHVSGCSKKASNPLIGVWDVKFPPPTPSFDSYTATFDSSGFVTMHVDMDASSYGMKGKGKIHLTASGTYKLERTSLSIKLYSQQSSADDSGLQKSLQKTYEGAKEMSKMPLAGKLTWISDSEFSLLSDGMKMDFEKRKSGLF